MTTTIDELPVLKNYINGEWIDSAGRKLPVINPATGKEIAYVPISTQEEANSAATSAREAAAGWAATKLSDRIGYLKKLEQLIRENRDIIIELLVRDRGKITANAGAEIDRALDNIVVASNISAYTGITVNTALPTTTFRRPLGTHLSINPYNFPLMVPFWSLPYAIATGNTSVVKASEQVPLTMDYVFGLLDQIGLPKGVVNLIHGDGTTAEYLSKHPAFDLVTFVGSTRVGEIVYGNASNADALCSAKNCTIVTAGGVSEKDMGAFLENMVDGVISAYAGDEGQRCAATSNLLVLRHLYDRVLARLKERSEMLKVGYGADEQVKIGPVISKKHLQNLHAFIVRAESEGAAVYLDGRNVQQVSGPEYQDGFFIGPTILTGVTPSMEAFRTEAFGPILNVIPIDSLEGGVSMINGLPYGNLAGIYTNAMDEEAYFLGNAKPAMLGVNVAIPAPCAPSSFGGTPGTDSLIGSSGVQGEEMIRRLTYAVKVTRNPNPIGRAASSFSPK